MLEVYANDLLIVVDMQVDFVSGTLSVPDATSIIKPIEKVKELFSHVALTRDYHPHNHCSFTSHGGMWPQHCIAGSEGADFVVSGDNVTLVISKGTTKDHDSYSGFFDTATDKTILQKYIDDNFIKRIFVCGLALDYCVRATAIDARTLTLKDIFVIEDLTRAVEETSGLKAMANCWRYGIQHTLADRLEKRWT